MEPITFFVETKTLWIIGHVLSVVVGMGAAIVTDILSFRYGFNKILSSFEVSTIRFLSKVVTGALLVIILTGIFIFLSNPAAYLVSVKFLIKMTVVGILIINGFLIHRFVFENIDEAGIITKPKYKSLRRLGFSLGAVSITSWVTALVLGSLDAIPFTYLEAFLLYLALLVLAVIGAVILESLLLRNK